jgi:hypothetical protein
MSEPAAPHSDPLSTTRLLSSPDSTVPPMPYPSTPTARPLSSPDAIVPPMPWEATNAHTQGSAAAGRWRMAMTPLRKMMRRTPRGTA